MPREVRLGIVLYGGVSLAVYENGVAQELYRAIRGEGIYSLVAKLIDSKIIVDIISGTSAGGVNGIMFAYAVARQTAFAPSAELWRNQADIMALLRKEGDDDASSILNSDYYQDKLSDCFQNTLASAPAPVALDELDLFITGTDANGDIYTIYDQKGHAIDVKNHRALFKLSIRKNNRKNDLLDAAPGDLAKLARLTSCFPVAFKPVEISSEETLFFRWGKLRKPAVYLDGGILNNKPFTSTIDAITTRTANCEVERFLIYVEPDPEVFQELPPGASPHSPSVVQAAAGALISIPGYQSIAADLQEIEAHNERAERIAAVLEAVGEPKNDASADCLDKTGVLPDTNDCDPGAYLAARAIQIRDAAVAGILNEWNGRPFIEKNADRRSGRILLESFDHWPGEAATTLTNYDVFYRMRRAAHLSSALMRRLKAGALEPDPQTWDLINHYFKLYEMTRWAMEQWLNLWKFDWRGLGPQFPDLDILETDAQNEILTTISAQVWGQAEARIQALLQGNVAIPEQMTAEARSDFYRQLNDAMNTQSSIVRPNLLLRLDDHFKAALKQLGDGKVAAWLRKEFCRFAEIDRQVFPFLFGAGSESTDIIRVVRFSPREAQRALSRGDVGSKVCGSTLGAFGGFFKKSWRANDIMIGRFDACCQLVECLVTKERLAALGTGRSVAQAEVAACFQNADPERDADLAAAINNYLANPQAATQESWDVLIDALVAAAHEDIRKEEWPRVVKCAVEQEYEWSQYRSVRKGAAAPYGPDGLFWRRARRKPDEVLMEVAANAIASGAIPPFQPGSVAGKPFLDEIPQPVLQELGSLAGIRVGKSLLASIPKKQTRRRVAGSGFYKWPFDRILPALYSLGRMRRTQPDFVIVLNTVIVVACVATWLVFALLHFYFHVYVGWKAGLTLVLAPLAVLWIWWKTLRR